MKICRQVCITWVCGKNMIPSSMSLILKLRTNIPLIAKSQKYNTPQCGISKCFSNFKSSINDFVFGYGVSFYIVFLRELNSLLNQGLLLLQHGMFGPLHNRLHDFKPLLLFFSLQQGEAFFFKPKTLNSNPWRQITLVKIKKSLCSQIRKPKQGLNVSLEVKERLPDSDFQNQEGGPTHKE